MGALTGITHNGKTWKPIKYPTNDERTKCGMFMQKNITLPQKGTKYFPME